MPIRTNSRKISCWLTVLFCLCLCTTAQAEIDSRLTYRRYTTQDELPQMQTERVWQDQQGYIYIGTLSGFVRFDGKTFTPFLKGRRENIVEFAEHDGQVRALGFRRQWYISDDDELSVVPIDDKGEWMLNNLNSSDLPNSYLLLDDQQEEHRRLCRVTATGLIPILTHPSLDRMTPDRKLWLDGKKLYIPSGDIYTYHRINDQLYAFGSSGISIMEGNRKIRIVSPAPEDWQQAFFGLIVRSRDSTTVIADEHSIYTFDGKSLQKIATGFNLIKDLLIDRWGRLWVATYEGAFCFFNRDFTNHSLDDRNDIVRAIGCKDDKLFMGTLNGKLMAEGHIISNDPQQFYQPSAATIGDKVFMAGNGDVCYYDDTQHWLHLPKDRYQFVAKAGQRLIIGSRNCLYAYHPDTGSIDTLSTEIRHPWCAAQDGHGAVWVGSSNGLFKDGKKVDFPQNLVITTMASDTVGNIIFASTDSLFLIQEGHVRPMLLNELQGHEVRSLHISPRGYLIAGVIDGLFVCRLNNDCQVSDIRFFDHHNGFTALEPLKATMAETSDGTIWMAGVEEMTSFNPEDLLSHHEEDTYIAPPLRWWQHWWLWLTVLTLLSLAIWGLARWYEKRLNRKKMIQLEREKLAKERKIDAIRQKAIEAETKPREADKLAKNIVEMTGKPDDTRLTFHTVSGIVIVEKSDIAYFKANGNYTQLITFQKTDTILMGMGALMKMLNQETFVRADRSTIVNLHNICRLDNKQRSCTFRSANGQEVKTSLLSPAFKRLEALL